MSFDLGVWSKNSKITGSRAGQIYERLCRGENPSELQPDPNIDSFYRELISQWPEIEHSPVKQVHDEDASPWSATINRSDAHVLITSVWSRTEEVYSFVQYLAQKHGLVLYDPQSDEMHAPE